MFTSATDNSVVEVTFVKNTILGENNMNKEYGYARISTPKQNIDRQVRNILVSHPQAHIVKEVYTGTKFQGRKELDKLLNKATVGDTIIFDSVSRMSRNAEEGFVMYEKLFNQGISLVFLKEPHINTDTYKKALQGGIPVSYTHLDVYKRQHHTCRNFRLPLGCFQLGQQLLLNLHHLHAYVNSRFCE